ncbi:hypothetical protein [Agrobacterium tumefaciens]|uniref:hypothetical protein n=1 Tax=Agrobacterium tumefaciens TaxID=358 RepID=UPI003B9FB0F8
MAKERKKQLNRRQGLTTLDIIRIRMSKLGGTTFRERAKWLIKQEENRKSLGAKRVPTEKDNLAAVERWLRDPSASSYQAAMWPRRKRKKPIDTD